MRKTSQDGCDATSITSGIENEIKKTGGLIKNKRNSIKRKVQSLSNESDDAVIEPLLQKDKEKTETPMPKQSAKHHLLSKTKTDIHSIEENDKVKLLKDDCGQKTLLSHGEGISDITTSIPSSNMLPKTAITAPLYNHMNTNVFSSHDVLKGIVTPKTQILIEIDTSKQSGYQPSPLIFTTAKIHTDNKTKQMEPLQVTPVPILSTIEVGVPKGVSIKSDDRASGIASNISTMYADTVKTNILEKGQISKPATSTDIGTNNKTSNSYGLPTNDKNNVTVTKKDAKVSESGQKQNKKSVTEITSGPCMEKTKIVALSNNDKFVETNPNTPKDYKVNIDSHSGIKDISLKQDKRNTITEQNTDLNKNFKVDIGQINKEARSNDKAVTNVSSKQLPRQKNAIDKDESATNSTTPQTKTSANNESGLSNKTILIQSTANNQTTINKSTLSDSIFKGENVKSADTKIKSDNVANSSSVSTTSMSTGIINSPIVQSNVKTSMVPTNVGQLSTQTSSSKTTSLPQIEQKTPKDIAKSPSAPTSTAKTSHVVSNIAKIVPIQSNLESSTISNSKQKQSVITNAVNAPITTVKSSTMLTTTAKAPSTFTSTNTVQPPAVSTTSAKPSSQLASAAKTQTAPITSTKASTVPTNSAKTSSEPMSTIKSQGSAVTSAKAVPTNSVNTQSSTIQSSSGIITAKNQSKSTSSTKIQPALISSAKSVSSSSAKTITTGSAQTLSKPSSTTKPSSGVTSSTFSTSVKSPSLSTTTTASTSSMIKETSKMTSAPTGSNNVPASKLNPKKTTSPSEVAATASSKSKTQQSNNKSTELNNGRT